MSLRQRAGISGPRASAIAVKMFGIGLAALAMPLT
jgi:hypothetical protein